MTRKRRAAETIGARVRRLRIERGLTQKDVAVPGVSHSYVSRIEAGERKPNVQPLRLLAARLGVTAEYLETGSAATTTDALAADAVRRTDGALWILLMRDGVTLTWQEAGDRVQLDRPGENLTEALLVFHERAGELARLDEEERAIRERREVILRERRAPE